MDLEEQRRERLANWAEMAAGWERAREHREKVAAPVTEWLVRALAPREGQTVLELAAGQGDVGYAVAPIVGESGRVISSDFSPGMVEIAERRSAELGLTNVAHRVFDAKQIELEDDSVDGVLCRFGYMLMPRPAAALRETRRVLRPGGRLALAVWSSGDRNPWMAVAGRILAGRGYMPNPEPGEPGMFVLGDENELRRLLEESDFAHIRIEPVPVHFDYADVDDYIRRANETGGMFARAWSAAPAAEQKTIKDEFCEAFAPFVVDGGYELPGLALCALAS
ncbi:MAG: class I SAM-dependent methyltransferase [Actinobacteria bacterium]|nr:class I SAM-dependent methyltransferase [Actinomycetota bacterium]